MPHEIFEKAEFPGLEVDLDAVQTNLVFVNTTNSKSAPEIAAALAGDGIRCNVFTDTRFRFATHYCVDMNDVERTLQSVHRALQA